MVEIVYFAWVREKTGIDREQVDLPESVDTIGKLMDWMRTRGPRYADAFENGAVIRAAINQTHVTPDAPLRDAQEIAFFPPVTGG